MAITSTTPLSTRLLRAFLDSGKAQATPQIPSEQLRAGLIAEEMTSSTGRLHVPHYWAQWVHDGRGPAPGSTGSTSILVWFRNPKDDPRYPGGIYPVRKSQIRHLSRGEFKKWSRINQRIINRYRNSTGKSALTASDYRAMDLPMIIAKNSPGDRGFVTGVPFFDNGPGGGMHGFRERANAIGARITSRYVTEQLRKDGLLNMKLEKTIRL